jgi:hypothetical protein
MPFRSEKQRRFLWARHPGVAAKFAADTPKRRRRLRKRKKR